MRDGIRFLSLLSQTINQNTTTELNVGILVIEVRAEKPKGHSKVTSEGAACSWFPSSGV